MKPTMTIDTREWVKAARELKHTSSRTTVDFINGQALRTAIQAVRETEKADASKIARELGAIGRMRTVRVPNRGRNKGERMVKFGHYVSKNDSLAERILWKRLSQYHTFGVGGDNMAQRVSNLIRARIQSRSFIASGWIWSRNTLFSVVRQKPSNTKTIAGVRKFGKAKGSAIPAKFSLRSVITALIENKAMNSTSRFKQTEGNAIGVATKGLQAAINFVAKDMMAELARRLAPDFKKVSAK